MTLQTLHLALGWSLILLGILSGALTGLFFHREDWAGGYGSFRRRLIRLGHIAFLGMGLLNLAFGLTTTALPMNDPWRTYGSLGFQIGGIGMPVVCYLTAWRKPLRHLFAVPVAATLLGTVATLLLLLGR